MLIKSGADVNSEREDGETAVHMAARKGNLQTFTLLLDEGGDSRTQSKVEFFFQLKPWGALRKIPRFTTAVICLVLVKLPVCIHG